jgi:hypothetical protein
MTLREGMRGLAFALWVLFVLVALFTLPASFQ